MVKVISLSEQAYSELKEIKGTRSFSEVVIDLIQDTEKKSLRTYFGRWKGNDTKTIKEQLGRERKKTKTREVQF